MRIPPPSPRENYVGLPSIDTGKTRERKKTSVYVASTSASTFTNAITRRRRYGVTQGIKIICSLRPTKVRSQHQISGLIAEWSWRRVLSILAIHNVKRIIIRFAIKFTVVAIFYVSLSVPLPLVICIINRNCANMARINYLWNLCEIYAARVIITTYYIKQLLHVKQLLYKTHPRYLLFFFF